MTTAAGAPVQPPVLPVPVRVHLAHAVIERIALDAGVDLLHVKGPATDPRLDPQTRSSSDVDVLVRPAHLADFQQALAAAGWRKFSSIERGSAFSHAANWWHDHWGYVDVHAHWPGARIDAEAAYDVFAEGGYLLPIAHQPCRVPGLVAQGLLRVMHEGRSRAGDPGRLAFLEHDSWLADVEALAQRVDAELALAAGLGQLDRFREDPAYDLWRFFGQGGSRWAEWRGRWRAARGVRAKAAVVRAAASVNPESLVVELGRPPTGAEVRRAQRARVKRAATDLAGVVVRRTRGLRRGLSARWGRRSDGGSDKRSGSDSNGAGA